MTIAGILRKAKSKIDDPSHWTRHTPARAEDDIPVDPESPLATKFCALGAVDAVTKCAADRLVCGRALDNAVCGIHDVADYNDTSHADVLALFDRTIAAAEAAQ